MSLQLCVDTPEEFFATLHFEDDANRERAYLAFRECIHEKALSAVLDFDLEWEGEFFDFFSREWQLVSKVVERNAPELASAFSADAYIPCRPGEQFRFHYVFDATGADAINFDIADLDTFCRAVTELSEVVACLPIEEERETLTITLASYKEAGVLAKARSCILSWSY